MQQPQVQMLLLLLTEQERLSRLTWRWGLPPFPVGAWGQQRLRGGNTDPQRAPLCCSAHSVFRFFYRHHPGFIKADRHRGKEKRSDFPKVTSHDRPVSGGVRIRTQRVWLHRNYLRNGSGLSARLGAGRATLLAVRRRGPLPGRQVSSIDGTDCY